MKEPVKARVRDIAREKAAITSAFLKQDEAERDNIPVAVSRFMQELKDSVKDGTIIVDDCWSSSSVLRRTLDFSSPGSFLRARSGGSIGWGLPGALGVRLGAPDRPVALSGDGSAAWSMQSLWTAAHYNIAVTFIILANATYRQVKVMRRAILGSGKLNEKHEGMELEKPVIDFCQLAQSMGVPGQKVDRPEKLRKVLKSALESDKPTLLEVCVENTP